MSGDMVVEAVPRAEAGALEGELGGGRAGLGFVVGVQNAWLAGAAGVEVDDAGLGVCDESHGEEVDPGADQGVDSEHAHGLGDSFEGVSAEVAEGEPDALGVLPEGVGVEDRLGHGGGAGELAGQGFESGGEVDGVAEDGEVAAGQSAEDACGDGAALKSDAEAQRGDAAEAEEGGEDLEALDAASDPVEELGGGGALPVEGVEDDHDAVADELVDRASCALQLLVHHFEHGAEHVVDALGVEVFAGLGVALDVGHEDQGVVDGAGGRLVAEAAQQGVGGVRAELALEDVLVEARGVDLAQAGPEGVEGAEQVPTFVDVFELDELANVALNVGAQVAAIGNGGPLRLTVNPGQEAIEDRFAEICRSLVGVL